MTTIAYRDGVLVGEGRVCMSHRIETDNDTKVFRLKNGNVIGVVGSALACQALVEHLNKAIKDKKKNTVELPRLKMRKVYAILAGVDTVWYFENGYWENITKLPYYAVGSGSDYAIAAMDAGASALEAVKVACKRDLYSGGKITSMTPKEV